MDVTFWLVIGLVGVVVWWTSWSADAGRRLGRLERKVDLILSHLAIDPNQGVDEKVMELMKAGKKIQAIKLYRQQTGCGLKEAKDYVEGL